MCFLFRKLSYSSTIFYDPRKPFFRDSNQIIEKKMSRQSNILRFCKQKVFSHLFDSVQELKDWEVHASYFQFLLVLLRLEREPVPAEDLRPIWASFLSFSLISLLCFQSYHLFVKTNQPNKTKTKQQQQQKKSALSGYRCIVLLFSLDNYHVIIFPS